MTGAHVVAQVAGAHVVDQVAIAQVVLDQVVGAQVVDQVAIAQVVLDQVVGAQVVDQVAIAQVVLDQVVGAQVVDQVAEAQVVDLVAGVQVHVDRVAGAVQMAVVILMSFRQTIGLVCDISNLSDNHNFELMLNNFTSGNGSEFAHQGHAEGGEEMEVVFSTGVANQVRVAGVFP